MTHHTSTRMVSTPAAFRILLGHTLTVSAPGIARSCTNTQPRRRVQKPGPRSIIAVQWCARATGAGGRLGRAPVGEVHEAHREVVVPA